MTFRKILLHSAIVPAAVLAIAAAAPASAQYYRWGPDVPPPGYGGRIHPQHIEAMVRSMGFQPVAEPRVRGPLWVTHAVDRNGQHVRVLIDSFSGRVIDVLARPVPPRSVTITPPPNLRTHPDIQNAPRYYPPQAAAPESDYDDNDGPDYDYRDQPQGPQRQFPQQPQYNPPQQYQYQQRPNTQQGPSVIPYEPRSNNDRLQNNQNKTATSDTKKKNKSADKADKKEKKDKTAAIDQEKKNVPSPKTRPQEAPQSAQTTQKEKPASEMKQAPDPVSTGTVPPVQPLDPNRKNEAPSAAPPVQPLL